MGIVFTPSLKGAEWTPVDCFYFVAYLAFARTQPHTSPTARVALAEAIVADIDNFRVRSFAVVTEDVSRDN
jgi:hypothetical protein